MNVAQIREKFLQFFASQGHTIVHSSSLVPSNDPTLLFTNSGMVQFKDVFLGTFTPPYLRATSAQRSLRAGGKHNDLENVGYTARHHTFFEMLGNFSFGDYFKRDAIRYAWTLLTEVYGLPTDKLWVTVYQEDDEAFAIWNEEIGVPKTRIVRIGDNKGGRYASDNFWQMADTGPCGPCSEIFYDHGPSVAGGPPGSPDEDGDRYIEVWNLVFMQFNRDAQGTLTPLPKPCVDTGMGLERIAAVLQGVHSNYEIDLFKALILAVARETQQTDINHTSLKVIADHIRACSFLICDGVIPGNEGRAYVLRRIIRRAIRHGYKLGVRAPFFYRLVNDLAKEMGAAYPELIANQNKIAEILKAEEARFFETLEYGMTLLGQTLAQLQATNKKVLDGDIAFKLHDTFGFPLDLTQDVCREHGVTVDEAVFEQAMACQRQQARAAGKFKVGATLDYSGAHTHFEGYEQQWVNDAKVLALYVDATPVAQLTVGQQGIVVLDRTPFYAESGGQVGDAGTLSNNTMQFIVEDVQKMQGHVFGHIGTLQQGALKIGDVLEARIATQQRLSIMRNHSATHLLHKALRHVLGEHVQQKGSLVDAQKTRFDFSHHAALTAAQISQVESWVNEEILANTAVQTRMMSFDDAIKEGAMALFGEKYSDKVRVLDVGHSRELCGGTHVTRTGDIGLCKIITESGVAAGVRRIEAVTGTQALIHMQSLSARIHDVAAALKTTPEEVPQRIAQLQIHAQTLERECDHLKNKLAANQGLALTTQAVDVAGIKVLAATLDSADAKTLRATVDALKESLGTAAIVLATVQQRKVNLVAGVTADTLHCIRAGDLVNFVAQQIDGKGGGKADMAQAGGNDPDNLPKALASVAAWVNDRATRP